MHTSLPPTPMSPCSDSFSIEGRFRRVRYFLLRRQTQFALSIVIFWVLLLTFAPFCVPYDPISSQDIYHTLAPPSLSHIFGTDEVGRDTFSRLLYGGRISLEMGVSIVVLGVFIGTIVGGVAGFFGYWIDAIVMRVVEFVLALPVILVAMAAHAVLEPSICNETFVLSLLWWPTYARIVRSMVLSLKHHPSIEALRALGASEFSLLWRALLPATIGPVVVLATLDFGSALLTLAGLSFIGFGLTTSTPEWGTLLGTAQHYPDQWWLFLFPGVALATLILGFNLLGETLRDTLDPRTPRLR